MPLSSSISSKTYLIVIAALLVLSMSFGALCWYRGTVIDAQSSTISQQAKDLDTFEKDKKAQDKADKKLKADKERIAQERNKYKKDLEDALKDSPCNDVPFDDNTQRLLNQLYGKQGS